MKKLTLVGSERCEKIKHWATWLHELRIPYECVYIEDLPERHRDRILGISCIRLGSKNIDAPGNDRSAFKQRMTYLFWELKKFGEITM